MRGLFLPKTTRDCYDPLNRLVEALSPRPSNPQESYGYDPVGNRTNSNQNGALTFNQVNQRELQFTGTTMTTVRQPAFRMQTATSSRPAFFHLLLSPFHPLP